MKGKVNGDRLSVNGKEKTSVEWTLPEMEQSLARRQALEVEFDGLVNEMERELAEVRGRYGQDMASVTLQIELEKKLQGAWMVAHKADFDGPPRSIEFAVATVGYRLGQPHLKPLSKWNWEKVLENLQLMNPEFVRQVPEVNREQLLAQADDFGKDGLGCLGLKVVQDDKPFIEIKRDKTAGEMPAETGVA